jgi:hypothetical protein
MRVRRVQWARTAGQRGLAVCRLILASIALCAPTASDAGVIPSSEPGISRDDEPVVITGSSIAALLGTPVSQLAIFRFDPASGTFVPIPFQVDQRLDVTFDAGRPTEFVEEDMYDVLHLDDGLLDDQDEIVFMFSDGGPQAPYTAAWPTGTGSLRYEATVRDERDEEAPQTRWAYVFAGPALPRSPTSYVSWGRGVSDSIVTPEFSLDYTDRWLLTGYRVAPPCGSGADLIDRFKVRSRPLGYPTVDEEVVNLNSEYLGGLSGPIRALRYVRGAKSGVNTIHFDRVSRGRWTRFVHLRVHPLQVFDVYFDWRPRSNALFYREGMAGPVPIDGATDAGVSSSFAAWNLVRGPGGGLFVAYDVPPSPLYTEKRLYYRDDAAYNDAPPESGSYPDEDDSAYGTHGLSILNVQESNFTPVTFSFRVEPLCSGEGSLDLALAHYELVNHPLEVDTVPQSPALGAVRGLVVRREGLDVVVSWPAAAGAAAYHMYSSLDIDLPYSSWTLEEDLPGTTYRDEGEAGRSGAKAYSVVAVAPDGTEGIW